MPHNKGEKTMNQVEQKLERMKRIERLLVKPMSGYEVSQITGWPKPSIRTYMAELHDRGRIHIGGWRAAGNCMTALFVAGQGEDLEKPCMKTELRPQEEDVFQRPMTEVHVHRDPMVVALFGEFRREERAAA
jgi:hypothetical protein